MALLVLLAVSAFATSVGSSQLVNVSFYSEALCPFCDLFTEGGMNEAVQKIGGIFTLHFVPWGNAEMKPDGSFECEHGPVECEMNAVEACVIHYYPNRSTWWPFIVCLEGYGPNQTFNVAEKCAGEQNITWPEVKSCADGPLGKSLEVMYYRETTSLDPPHEYTPWILINGKHVVRTQIIKKICDAYNGTNKPTACNNAQHNFSPVGGCYRQPTQLLQ